MRSDFEKERMIFENMPLISFFLSFSVTSHLDPESATDVVKSAGFERAVPVTVLIISLATSLKSLLEPVSITSLRDLLPTYTLVPLNMKRYL